mmetsp:Transcript_4757/g.14515  ORF Transcript_4757/g.14515 Transcript_4757/m.14515 type:complete len:277 (-) Transcript_4757:1628-2458(-)
MCPVFTSPPPEWISRWTCSRASPPRLRHSSRRTISTPSWATCSSSWAPLWPPLVSSRRRRRRRRRRLRLALRVWTPPPPPPLRHQRRTVEPPVLPQAQPQQTLLPSALRRRHRLTAPHRWRCSTACGYRPVVSSSWTRRWHSWPRSWAQSAPRSHRRAPPRRWSRSDCASSSGSRVCCSGRCSSIWTSAPNRSRPMDLTRPPVWARRCVHTLSPLRSWHPLCRAVAAPERTLVLLLWAQHILISTLIIVTLIIITLITTLLTIIFRPALRFLALLL